MERISIGIPNIGQLWNGEECENLDRNRHRKRLGRKGMYHFKRIISKVEIKKQKEISEHQILLTSSI